MSVVERALAKAGLIRRAGSSGVPSDRPPRVPATSTNEAFAVDEARRVDLASESLRAAGLLPPANAISVFAEELRLIKRPLLLNAEGATHLANGNLVMMASALPGAGKTFLSLNLALSMSSELDWSVVLVDADIARSHLSTSLGLADAPGLVTLLEQERGDIATYLFQTGYPNLHILPAGPNRPNVKELLGSKRMTALVEDLAQRGRVITIFDSPPLLLTSDARVLASYVGQVVLVVEADVTPRASVLESIEMLDASKAINLVLNKATHRFGLGSYQAGYFDYASVPTQEAEK